MQYVKKTLKVASATAIVLLAAACSSMGGMGGGISEKTTAALTGGQEVPPVATSASGRSTISVASDRSVSGSVIVSGMEPTAAHIHQGAMGTNGPVVVPLTKTSATTFAVPAGAKLTDAQYAAFVDGNLYVNVHSAKNPGGEVRVQMKP
ncbi:MAG: CHRD domain-containing protein [Noviherbaspirillum sp.]